MENAKNYDYLIIGGGIMGLTIGFELRKKYPEKSIAIIEKEEDVAMHASGRNSGVLHAGFYYTSSSLKAKFTVDGNRIMKAFCYENGIHVNECHKVVVASDASELEALYELERRGKQNGVDIKLIDEEELFKIEPNSRTYKYALYSPTTASVDPIEVCQKIKEILITKKVDFFFNNKYIKKENEYVMTNQNTFKVGFLINAAGLYADVIARDYGYSKDRIIIPFKGIYLKYSGSDMPISTNIYPVPNLLNPFLGVHYTVTSHNHVKIGPTSIPAFWRENYDGFSNFKLNEFLQITYYEAILFITNAFNFRKLAINEIKKYNRKHFVSLAKKLTKKVDEDLFNDWLRPGIRAQLLNKKTKELEMDFVVEGDTKSLHLLNAVSPAFTCSFSLAKFLVDEKVSG
ncbi:MAG: L-2-hydroxyglutarate oxidase [Bacteroidales bacterium]